MKAIVNQFWNFLDKFRGAYNLDDLKETFFSILYLKYYNQYSDNRSFQARWENLEHEHNPVLLMKGLLVAFEELEQEQPLLQGIVDDFELKITWSRPRFESIVRSIFQQFSFIERSEKEYLSDNFFDELLNLFDKESGKTSSSAAQPKELTKLMQSFIPQGEGFEIYNPFAGVGSIAIGLDKSFKYLGVENNRKTRALGQLRLLIHNSQHNSLEWGNALYDLQGLENKKFDFVIFNPPFNVRLNEDQYYNILSRQNQSDRLEYLYKGNATSYIVNHCFRKVKESGKMIFVIPNSFLISNNINDIALRKRLLQHGHVETIIALPSGLLSSTNISINLVVLSRSTSLSKVRMFDAKQCAIKLERNRNQLDVKTILNILNFEKSSELSRFVDNQEIVENNYSLLPSLYLNVENIKLDLEEAVKLGSVINYIQPLRVLDETTGKRVGIRELADIPDSFMLNANDLEESMINRNMAILPNSSLLIASRGDKLKPTFYNGNYNDIYYSVPNILTFEVVQNKVLLDYLIPELYKDYVTTQLNRFRQGSTIPSLKREELLSIRIHLPSLKEQAEIVSKEKNERFQARLKELGFENEIARLKREQKEDLRSKKHNILQHMNNVKSSADVLIHFMKKNNGRLNAEDVISPKLKVTVEKRFMRLLESLGDAIYFVDNLTNDITFGKQSIINLKDLINVSIEKGLQTDAFEIKLDVDSDSFIDSELEIEPLVKISESDFLEFYNNIVENAINHGFTAKDRHYILLIELFYSLEEKKIVLRFSNNGTPFAKGMSERYGIKGEKAGKTGNRGYGAWKVIEIVKYWNAEFKVIDLPKEQFPVGLELKFNLEQE